MYFMMVFFVNMNVNNKLDTSNNNWTPQLHLADAFIQSDLQLHCLYIFISMCVPWESNPQTFALLMQCSTTLPL